MLEIPQPDGFVLEFQLSFQSGQKRMRLIMLVTMFIMAVVSGQNAKAATVVLVFKCRV